MHYNISTTEEAGSKAMQNALSSFLEKSLYSPQEGLRYIICPLSIWERILGCVPLEARRQNNTTAARMSNISSNNTRQAIHDPPVVLSPDENLWTMEYHFTSMTFLGQEHELTMHDFLTFTVASYIFHNTYASALVTYIVHTIRSSLRAHFGTKNLAKKTFINPRFLLRI